MKNFLRSIKVIQDYSITLNCSKPYFLNKLRENVGVAGFEVFEGLVSGRPFKGRVGDDDFKIRQRRQGFQQNLNWLVKYSGIVMERDEKAVVSIEANGFHWFFGFLFGIVIVAYFGVIGSLMISAIPGMQMLVLIFVIPIHALLMLGLPYFFLRRSVSNSKREIEKEFHFLTKDFREESIRQI